MLPFSFLLLISLLTASSLLISNGNAKKSFLHINKPSNLGFSRKELAKNLSMLRGGQLTEVIPQIAKKFIETPTGLFNALLLTLSIVSIGWKVTSNVIDKKANADNASSKPKDVASLQLRFLTVFWLMRMADWLQGPYFYEVYSSKLIGGLPVSLDLVSKLFLVGFASTGLFGPWMGRLVDSVGRKFGTIAFAVLYTIGAISTKSNLLPVLLLGRVAGGLGTSLLFSAPEAWLVGEHNKQKFDGKWLGQTFGLAYAGDAIVAICAGQLASLANSFFGPTGPFLLSIVFLFFGSLIAFFKWDENVATKSIAVKTTQKNIIENDIITTTTQTSAATQLVEKEDKKPSVFETLVLMSKNSNILLVGAVQALFEGAMYIFVLQWPPAVKAALQAASAYGANAVVPYGSIFSCFMASCLLGSLSFSALQAKKIKIETSTSLMLLIATIAITIATLIGSSNLYILIAALFVFESCVGMYFPSIGTLRSKYLPDSHRSVIMNIFGIPLNLIVVSVFLSIKYLGVAGALTCSSVALGLSTLFSLVLLFLNKK
jgi:MFS family permease